MAFAARQQIIKEIQELRRSTVITYFNADRRAHGLVLPAMQTKLATEAQPYFYNALASLGKRERIDLFLYTTGGQTDSVWPLVSILREFSEELNVIVPYKAHSAGTLICLGADNMLLGELSELSPVDPTTGNPFNPPFEQGLGNGRKLISVEDVTSYFDLANDPAKQKTKDGKNQPVKVDLAFEVLARQVHPLALGNVNRSHRQIRELARRLLNTNKKFEKAENRIDNIVNTLTEGRYSHSDILNRNEVQGLLGEETVKFVEGEEKRLIYLLYQEYSSLFELESPYLIQNDIGNDPQKQITVKGAVIETMDNSLIFKADMMVFQRTAFPQGVQLNIQPGQPIPIIPGLDRTYAIELQSMGWTQNKEGV